MFDNVTMNDLSDIDLSIIRYVKNNPEKVSLMRVRDLAEACHVSPATIMRFIRKFGFDSFPSFKLSVKSSIVDKQEIEEAKRVDLITNAHFQHDIYQKINVATQQIIKSKIVYCVGLGSSGIMAEYMSQLLNSIGFTSISYKTAYLPILWNENIQSDESVIIMFSVSGETKELLPVARTLRNSKPFFISITNDKVNTLARSSNLNIPYFIQEDRLSFHVDLSSQMPVIYIIESIIKNLHKHRLETEKTIL